MKIGAVIVTYNRLEKLKLALRSFEEQSLLPAYLIVVDNGSTDGTTEYLENWKREAEISRVQRIVISMGRNTGGSGGFHAGLKAALEIPEVDWIWVSDDDAYPEKDALKNASEFLDAYGDTSDLSAICGKVIRDGKIDYNHGKYYKLKGIKITENRIPPEEYAKPSFEMYGLTYVASVMNKKKLMEVGITNQDYFIYWDDLEHGLRLRKAGRIIGVPSVSAYHDAPKDGGETSWRIYYSLRNMTYTYIQHYPGIPFMYYAFKVRLKLLYNRLTGQKNARLNVLDEAFHDALAGRLGINEHYKPGQKI